MKEILRKQIDEVEIPGLGRNSDGSLHGRDEPDLFRLHDFLESKYTHLLTDRHAVNILRLCRQYARHYNGLPYSDLVRLASLVRHVLHAFHQGIVAYGPVVKELCTIASKPFISLNMSDEIRYSDAAVNFIVTLCQAAAAGYTVGHGVANFPEGLRESDVWSSGMAKNNCRQYCRLPSWLCKFDYRFQMPGKFPEE